MRYKYFDVQPLPMKPGRKTHDWVVINLRSGEALGWIRWYGPWRQYCLFAEGGTVWSTGCLQDLQEAMKSIEASRRSRKIAASQEAVI